MTDEISIDEDRKVKVEATLAAQRESVSKRARQLIDETYALRDAKRCLEGFMALYKVIVALEDLGGVQQFVAEEQKKFASMPNPQDVLAKAQAEATAIIAHAKDVEAAAQAKAGSVDEQVLAKTKAQAQEIIDKARAVADQHEDRARQAQHQASAAVAAHRDAMAGVDKANNEKARVEKAIADLKAKL
jgi:hypothetical protein